MDKSKPFLSGLLFLSLSLCGIQPGLAAAEGNSFKADELFAPAQAERPLSHNNWEPVDGLREYAFALFKRVKYRVADAFQYARSQLSRAGDIAPQTDFARLLGIAFQPIIDEARTRNLKAVLPSAAWLFLSGILGALALNKRKTGLAADMY